MSNLESSITPVDQVDSASKNSFWPMMIFKLIIGQKLFSPYQWLGFFTIFFFALAGIFFYLSQPIEYLNKTNFNAEISHHSPQDLDQELAKYQRLYQEQLVINQQLQAKALQLENAQQQQDEESELLPLKSQFEHALEQPQTFEQSQSLRLPLAPAIETSLFRMIPNDTPVDYRRVSSPFGERTHPISGKWSRHLGMDLTCPRGTPIFATADGVVEITRPSNQGYGNMIKIRHAFGFMTLYAHLDQFAVKTGQFIEKGDRIGFCGSSGNSTGSHLHYEVRFIGKTLNPKDFIQWQPSNIAQLFERQKQVPWTSLIAQLTTTVNLQVLLAMSSKEHTSKSLTKQARTSKEGLTAFGIKEDGWATVEE